MASATLTPSHARFGASFSGNVSRPEFHQTEGLSMADQLPSINFGFDDLRERMMQFTARFDEFIERGRKRVLEERNHFRLNVAEIQGMYKRNDCALQVLTVSQNHNAHENATSTLSRTKFRNMRLASRRSCKSRRRCIRRSTN